MLEDTVEYRNVHCSFACEAVDAKGVGEVTRDLMKMFPEEGRLFQDDKSPGVLSEGGRDS